MKKIITLFSVLISLISISIGQLTTPNFTLTDLNGNTYNLYDELDNGKTIIIDFFSLQ